MKSLQTLMKEQLVEGGVAIPGGRDPHIELIETAMGRVWMSVEPATQQDYEELLEGLDDSLRGMGIGAASMDAALFRYSPGGEGEPVCERTIGGRRFIHVAIPGERTSLPEGASLKTIELQEPWVISLPTPTRTLWHFGSGIRSFQGPVSLPSQ